MLLLTENQIDNPATANMRYPQRRPLPPLAPRALPQCHVVWLADVSRVALGSRAEARRTRLQSTQMPHEVAVRWTVGVLQGVRQHVKGVGGVVAFVVVALSHADDLRREPMALAPNGKDSFAIAHLALISGTPAVV